MAEGIPARLTAVEGRRFAFPVAGAFAVLAGVVFWRQKETAALVLGGLAALLGLAGALAPTALGPVQRAWMGFAHALSKITTPIFMGLVYFVVMTPIGLLRRALGFRSLVHASPEGSYWVRRGGVDGTTSDLERQF